MTFLDYRSHLGVPPPWKEEMWPVFEKMSLDVLTRALASLRNSGNCLTSWKENKFSAGLLAKIDEIRHRDQLPFFPHDESRLLADVDDPDSAPKIDLAIRHHGMQRPQYFGVEAKVLTTKTMGSRRPKKCVDDYIEEGIARFVEGKYGSGSGSPSGAMIGYVIAGSIKSLIPKIDGAIKLRWPSGPALRSTGAPQQGVHTFHSRHSRNRDFDITLYHLMCKF